MTLKFHVHEAETMIRSIMRKTQLSKISPKWLFSFATAQMVFCTPWQKTGISSIANAVADAPSRLLADSADTADPEEVAVVHHLWLSNLLVTSEAVADTTRKDMVLSKVLKSVCWDGPSKHTEIIKYVLPILLLLGRTVD